MIVNTLSLRDRLFRITDASITRAEESWYVDINTEREMYDDESWQPYLYHQGLLIPANSGAELEGVTVAWGRHSDPDYVHPELGVMYVFGHHPVRDCKVVFGKFDGNLIEFSWTGICDIFWDGEYSQNVPFSCICHAVVNG